MLIVGTPPSKQTQTFVRGRCLSLRGDGGVFWSLDSREIEKCLLMNSGSSEDSLPIPHTRVCRAVQQWVLW
ncbi:hypothetical protein DOTSEDRAFT_73745 [Dothistroma septosporum NZE10]|uniref:Uncharacterized protein n=1 Tax=Dothistroma septosporum (strain NZE10 / CBS 128990) TaxID=675120 RepID=N1PIQ4_DOTSN|nr:hypothetical protein DOTSEDRAFT_73745 [Dothistroma septosporum NZE10]